MGQKFDCRIDRLDEKCKTHPPLSICAKPVLTPKVPAPPPLVPVVLVLFMMLGVEDPLEFPLPLAVVGKALAEGTIVGFSEDIVVLVGSGWV